MLSVKGFTNPKAQKLYTQQASAEMCLVITKTETKQKRCLRDMPFITENEGKISLCIIFILLFSL